MKKANILISILSASLLIFSQFNVAFAAPKLDNTVSIAGTVQAVTLETDPNTGVTSVLVDIKDEHSRIQTVRISLKTAESPELGLVTLNEDGNPVIVNPLPGHIEIGFSMIIPDEQPHNPVASALASLFSSIPDLDYAAIMKEHSKGNSFGVIVQALFMTEKLGGDVTVFQEILRAKKDNDYSNFPLDDGTIPVSWGQLRKAISEKHLGIVMLHNNGSNNNSDNENNSTSNSNKDKNKDKTNHGNGNANSHGNGNGNGNPTKP